MHVSSTREGYRLALTRGRHNTPPPNPCRQQLSGISNQLATTAPPPGRCRTPDSRTPPRPTRNRRQTVVTPARQDELAPRRKAGESNATLRRVEHASPCPYYQNVRLRDFARMGTVILGPTPCATSSKDAELLDRTLTFVAGKQRRRAGRPGYAYGCLVTSR